MWKDGSFFAHHALLRKYTASVLVGSCICYNFQQQSHFKRTGAKDGPHLALQRLKVDIRKHLFWILLRTLIIFHGADMLHQYALSAFLRLFHSNHLITFRCEPEG